MYGNYYNYSNSLNTSGLESLGIWMIISVVIAIAGGIVVYILFLNKENENKFTGFTAWLYDFLSFKKMFMEALLKITYLIVALYITLSSFALIGVNFWAFLGTLIIGNVVARLIYEFSLLLLVICRNTTEINKKLSKKDKEDK